MEWPKRARTAAWESGVLTLDGEKQFEIPELTMNLIERLAGYTLVGFHVKDYPVSDELLAAFAGHKSMVNFGVENAALTDACFPIFSAMPKQYMEQAGFEDSEAAPRLLAIWERYVSEKPRPGYRPLALSYSAQGTYKGEGFLDAEQITKNKLYIYTREENTGFDRRFLMKRVDGSWKIDAVQERLDGWQRVGL